MPQRRYFISGRVQGVWFRESTRRKALDLGLNGCATNLADGRVEVLAEGPDTILDELAEWLKKGPPMARVSSVDPGSADFGPISGFSVA